MFSKKSEKFLYKILYIFFFLHVSFYCFKFFKTMKNIYKAYIYIKVVQKKDR